MSHPSETASPQLSHQWAPIVNEVQPGRLESSLKPLRHVSTHPDEPHPHMRKPACARFTPTPSSQPVQPHQPGRPTARHPYLARRPWRTVRRVWAGVGEHSPLKEQKGADCPKASSTFQGCPLMWARRNKSRPTAIACGSLSRGNDPLLQQ